MNDSAIFGILGLLIGGGLGFMVGLVLLRRHLAVALEALDERDAAHSRCSDSQSVLHDKVQSLRSLCSNRKDSTAIAAMKIIGGGK
jgi:hypothetical protein